jgi:hypothetical protein
MAFVPVPATVKVSLFYTYNGQPCMNRIYVSTPASLPDAATCQVLANAAANWWINNCKALCPPTCELRLVEAISVAEQNGPSATVSAGLPSPGTNGSPALPGNNTLAVSLRTGLTGRSARGRWYWVGLSEAQVTDNLVLAGPAASIVAAMDALISTINGLSSQPVIVSFVSGGIPRPGGPVKFIINDALLVDTVIDSQRGRLR